MAKTKHQIQHHREIDLINNNRSSYNMVVLSSLLAKHLRYTEEFKDTPVADVIKMAVTDIYTGKISKKKIMELAGEKQNTRTYARKPKEKESEKSSAEKS